jgi:hypothetical protein
MVFVKYPLAGGGAFGGGEDVGLGDGDGDVGLGDGQGCLRLHLLASAPRVPTTPIRATAISMKTARSRM